MKENTCRTYSEGRILTWWPTRIPAILLGSAPRIIGKGKDVTLHLLFADANGNQPLLSKGSRPVGRVLVVDRDSKVRTTIESLLMIAACTVITAPSAAAGLRFMRIWHPTLVFLDAQIRPRAPLEAVRTFWEAGQRRVPLVLLGGTDLEANGGCDGMISGALPKPFDVRELLATTARFVTCGDQ
jgi:CheY-like chemotaxis protein